MLSRKRASYPEQPNEALGRFVGIADVVGASITFKILTEEMKIIIRSAVRTATKEGAYKNRRAENHAPTLTPKPVSVNLKIGEQVEGITNSSTPDDIDHGTVGVYRVRDYSITTYSDRIDDRRSSLR